MFPRVNNSIQLVVVAMLLMGSPVGLCFGQELKVPLSIRLREVPVVDSNILRVKDLCELRGEPEEVERLGNLPLAPSPMAGATQTWTRRDVDEHLRLRGVETEKFRWTGNDSVGVSRVAAPATNLASFRPAFVNDRSADQAKRNVEEAIRQYIQFETGERSPWIVQAEVPADMVKTLVQRRAITKISGGEAPWTGPQKFQLQLVSMGKTSFVDVTAEISLPDMVVVAKKSLRRDQLITVEDLDFAPLDPRWSASEDAVWFTDPQELIGKQLRRAQSSGQPIEASDVGSPILIQRNDMVEIEVISGSITIKTTGRATTAGAMGDLVTVEVLPVNPKRKKLNAQVVGPAAVRILSQATTVSNNGQ